MCFLNVKTGQFVHTIKGVYDGRFEGQNLLISFSALEKGRI